MLGKIISINENIISVELSINVYSINNLIDKIVTFYNKDSVSIGEVLSIKDNIMEVNLVGEIVNNTFIFSDIHKPSFNSPCYMVNDSILNIILSNNAENTIKIGKSYLYPNYDMKIDINNFFSNHFAILGNSGSGKSYSVAKIIQSVFYQCKSLPINASIFLFDAYGEYQNAFNRIHEVNENINYKVITTNQNSTDTEILKIPFWLLTVDDIALLLGINCREQLPIIEKALKLVYIFTKNSNEIINDKNNIIASSILDIIFSGKAPSLVRNKIVSLLTKFNTETLNLDFKLQKGGWARTIRQCLFIEEGNKFADIELVIEYLENLCSTELELSLPNGSFMYTMKDFYNALDFALIAEGTFSSNETFELANILKIRFNSLMNSDYSTYFNYNGYINREMYIKSIMTSSNGKRAQIINFNINYIDDRFAKNLVKIYSKLLFDYITSLKDRASMPVHIVLEEAHRYVQKDIDVEILGYNIFERIAKEGRKYGIFLGIVSQRPFELSETTISQCNNFLIFKMFHPKDLQFVKDIISSADVSFLNKIKNLAPGTCILFGSSSRMPTITVLEKPNPEPYSQNCDINKRWYMQN